MVENKEFELEDFQKGWRQTSVYIPNDLWVLAKQNLIEFKSAMIFGIKFLIAENQGYDYPDNKLSNKILKLTQVIDEQSKEISKLTAVPDPDKIAIAEKEADEILNKIGA